MKKITRRSFLAAMAAVSAAGVLTACGGSGNAASSAAASESASVSSEAVSSAASADETGTHIVIDHGGNEVEVPNKVTRVVIDQIPILSTYMAYFEGSVPLYRGLLRLLQVGHFRHRAQEHRSGADGIQRHGLCAE